MTTRYQEKHYEDAARILREHKGCCKTEWVADDFADLFAANNPPTCRVCGESAAGAPPPCERYDGHHEWTGGFDREQFLSACGLESEG